MNLNKRMKYLLLLLFGLTTTLAFAQKVEYTATFLEKLAIIDATISTPLDSDYKNTQVLKDAFQNYDFAIKSRKEKLEIRYFIEAIEEDQRPFFHPHLRFTRFLMHLAGNGENSILALHDVSESDLQNEFQADWGKVAFFQPKEGFRSAVHCKLLCLYKAGKGMVYVLFLFDKPSEGLDSRFYAIQFKE